MNSIGVLGFNLVVFSLALAGCSGVSDEEINKVIAEEIQNQVYVEGGTFQFGDVNHLSYNKNDDIDIKVQFTLGQVQHQKTCL